MTEFPSMLRERGRGAARVTMVELFFDLVFVFAITQLSHTLLEHLDGHGVLATSLLFLAIWWLWIFTSWALNWLDPGKLPVRLAIFALMLGGLLLSAAIPRAFGDAGALFGITFAAMQVGRTLFVIACMKGRNHANYLNFVRILAWFGASAVFWVVGGFQDPEARMLFWLAAVAIEYAGPQAYFWTPGLGPSKTTDWDIEGEHLAERCALFVIIALGESILVTGATFAGLEWTRPAVLAFLVAFAGSVAMWWIYFDTGAERGSHRLSHSDDPGRQARSAYTYAHIPIIAGIVVCAVADEIALVHPGHLEAAGLWIILAGPALYLAGNALFKWILNDRRTPPLSHLAGLALLALLLAPALHHQFSALGLATATTVVLIIVAAWESFAIRR